MRGPHGTPLITFRLRSRCSSLLLLAPLIASLCSALLPAGEKRVLASPARQTRMSHHADSRKRKPSLRRRSGAARHLDQSGDGQDHLRAGA
ncbi:hypothetical protein GFL91_33135 [Rhizobium leguminosarum bv. viciae]|uniref:Uncharacterized protein n=1 Tax=Rhizobium leguminosarum bv. viciae TaxID=387 RepID=A0A8I2KK11_RHILV|nr:hypothetical protein [Rhizobium leguminosarum bv. viciae]NKM98711.1 hypothetical protein [Rhizobium leguminosarum bv. viciae]